MERVIYHSLREALPPNRSGGPVGPDLPEAEVGSGARFHHPEDLPRVHREVLDHVVDRLEHGDVVSLDRAELAEPRGIQTREHRVHVAQRLLEPPQRVRCVHTRARGELRVASAHVRLSADPAHDPLACVARQVEQQISHAVGRLVGPPPEVLRRELRDRQADARQIVVRQVPARALDERAPGVVAERRLPAQSSHAVTASSHGSGDSR